MTTNLYQPQPASSPSPETQEHRALIHQRIQSLTPRLIAKSHFIPSDHLEPDDLQQEMFIALLEKAQAAPGFAEQKDAYLVRYATWMAKHAAERTWTYSSHVESQTLSLAGEDEVFDNFSDDNADPAYLVEQSEELEEMLSRLQDLSPENRTVVKMIYLGYTESEIATELGISRPAVTQRKRTIARAISA